MSCGRTPVTQTIGLMDDNIEAVESRSWKCIQSIT